jgi:Tfp pilus assembly protein FimT
MRSLTRLLVVALAVSACMSSSGCKMLQARPQFRAATLAEPVSDEAQEGRAILALARRRAVAASTPLAHKCHSNWQWWQLDKKGHAVVLDKAPAGYRPIGPA